MIRYIMVLLYYVQEQKNIGACLLLTPESARIGALSEGALTIDPKYSVQSVASSPYGKEAHDCELD